MARGRRVIEAFVSGCIVYGLMAACSSGAKVGQSAMATASNGSSGSGGHVGSGGHAGTGGVAHASSSHVGAGGHGGVIGGGGNGGASGAGGDSGIVDALMDPVGDAFAGAENPASGTRLKGKFIAGADGSKMYLPSVWYDSQRQEDCQFGIAADGMLRCLPTNVQAFVLFYTDAQCTMPFAVLATPPPPAGCAATPPKYNVTTDQGGVCPSAQSPPNHYYPIGQQIAQPSGTIYAATGGSCHQTQIGFSTLFFAVMAEVPASAFVAGTAGNDP